MTGLELHLFAEDAPSATGPAAAPAGEHDTVIDLGLDDGRRLFLHLGEASLELLTYLFDEYGWQREEDPDGDFDARMFGLRPGRGHR